MQRSSTHLDHVRYTIAPQKNLCKRNKMLELKRLKNFGRQAQSIYLFAFEYIHVIPLLQHVYIVSLIREQVEILVRVGVYRRFFLPTNVSDFFDFNFVSYDSW